MFFFPIRTDRRLKRKPWVNYALIAANVLIFLFTESAVNQHIINQAPHTQGVGRFFLTPFDAHLQQFLTYQFLHYGKMHIIFNMLFLFVFGNGVEDRMGRLGYLLFYLAGGVIAGLGHCLTSGAPVLGASGSVAAVTGAYLALFPMSNVTIVYWFFFIGSFEISSMLLILFRVAQDALFQFFGYGTTAYMAHLAGYATGFAVGMGLLFARILPREPYDMLSLIEHRRRRSQFQRLTRTGYHPWQSAGARDTPQQPASPQDQEVMRQREQIGQAIAQHDMPAAARLYRDLLAHHEDQVLSQQPQLDVANQLMSEGRYDTAAVAYELFLRHYPKYPQREHVQLILALIHGRYLANPQRSVELLRQAQPHLAGDDRQLADTLLHELDGEQTGDDPQQPDDRG